MSTRDILTHGIPGRPAPAPPGGARPLRAPRMPALLGRLAIACSMLAPGSAAQDPSGSPPDESAPGTAQTAEAAGASDAASAADAAAPQVPPEPVSPELAAAEAALAETRRQKEAAYAALEAMVHELADDYAALTAGPEAAAHVHALVLAVLDSMPTVRTRLAAEAARGRALLRGTRRQILHDAFAGPVGSATPLDPRLTAWIATRVADRLSTRESFDALTEVDVLGVVRELFPAGLSWYEFWNQHFHTDLPAAQELQRTTTDYEAAGLAVDRLRHPERYGSRGEVAPAGMVVVPGGSYELGPNTGWERPAHRVSLKVFALDRHEVTRGQYELYVNALPPGQRAAVLPRDWQLDERDVVVADPGLRDHPVIHVNFEQAAAYAAWAGKRLPTEDEWEAAAGGINGLAYPWGHEFRPEACNGGDESDGTLPVESFPQGVSPAGCFDMAGNAWEWTSTLEDGKDFTELPEGLINVIVRGGGYNSRREELVTRYRWTAPGHEAFASSRYTRPIGFRCAKDLQDR
jgi:formylglycine-generating enzyme required for sulfatase activity